MHARATSLDLPLDVEYNPFADSPQRRPSLTRHLSSESASARTGHLRARTEYDPAGHHHPLKSAGTSSESTDLDVTRPSLIRVLHSQSQSETETSSLPESPSASEKGKKTVLIHEIQPTDSLAGVALKYGMNLADLRRANHLWANDSIHLRKTLYIPLDKAKKATDIIDLSNESDQTDETDSIKAPTNGSASPPSITKSPPSTLRRVPASELSFFPPPARRAVSSFQPRPLHLRQTSSPASSPTSSNPSLATLLSNALPITDNIISRLSFENTSSSYSDRGRASMEQERSTGHELEDVRPSLDGGLDRIQKSKKLSAHGRAATTWELWQSSSAPARRVRPKGSPTAAKETSSSSPPPSPRSIHSIRTIRTNQLQPQPEMHVPPPSSIRSNSSGRSYKTYSAGDRKEPPSYAGNGFSVNASPKKKRPGLRDVRFERQDADGGIELG